MHINGRDKPIAVVATDSETMRTTIRVDFILRPDAWVEITLTRRELEDLLAGKETTVVRVRP